jgi:hypothetical protein
MNERERPARKNLSVTLGVRFTPEEAEHLRQVAQQRCLSYSDIVRAAVKAYMPHHTTPLLRGRNFTHICTVPPETVASQAAVEFGGAFSWPSLSSWSVGNC